MKKTGALLAALLTFDANAQMMTREEATIPVCTKVSQLAEALMDVRQSGVGMAAVLKNIKPELEKLKGQFPKIIEDMPLNVLMAAYEYPLMSLPENKKSAITEFANQQMVKCIREMKSGY